MVKDNITKTPKLETNRYFTGGAKFKHSAFTLATTLIRNMSVSPR